MFGAAIMPTKKADRGSRGDNSRESKQQKEQSQRNAIISYPRIGILAHKKSLILSVFNKKQSIVM